jgi:2-iminobutanoate/2-iminopropanoate deaminase
LASFILQEITMLDRQAIQVPGLKTIGPYSQAVRAAGLVFVAGQPGVNPSSGEAAGSAFAAQARQAFKNLETVLQAGGSRLDLVVNTTVLVTDISNFAELNLLFAEFFPKDPPARMVMQVPLPKGLLISIGCVAVAAT